MLVSRQSVQTKQSGVSENDSGLLARTKARLMTECTGVTEAGTNNPFLVGKSLITLLVETEVIFIVMIDNHWL